MVIWGMSHFDGEPLYIICINLNILIQYIHAFKHIHTHTHIPMKREATDMFKGLCCSVSCLLRQCASHSDIPRRTAVVCRILDQFHGW